MEADSAAIRAHALFPVLELALEACEQVTLRLADPKAADNHIAEKLSEFAAARSAAGEAAAASEVDRVVCLAIGVLRVQLAEMAKVRLLCHEFCERYIANLRSKLSQEQLLGFAADSDDEESRGPPTQSSPGSGGSPEHSLRPRAAPMGPVATLQTPAGPVTVQLSAHGLPILRPPPAPAREGYGPGFPLFLSPALGKALRTGPAPEPPVEEEAAEGGESNNNRKPALPEKATDVLRVWLFQHAAHPYPSEAEKRLLAVETGLSLMQVNNWFINARRRILQPMACEAESKDTSPETATEAAGEEGESPQKRSKLNGSSEDAPASPIPKPMLTSAQSREAHSSSSSLDALAERLARQSQGLKE